MSEDGKTHKHHFCVDAVCGEDNCEVTISELIAALERQLEIKERSVNRLQLAWNDKNEEISRLKEKLDDSMTTDDAIKMLEDLKSDMMSEKSQKELGEKLRPWLDKYAAAKLAAVTERVEKLSLIRVVINLAFEACSMNEELMIERKERGDTCKGCSIKDYCYVGEYKEERLTPEEVKKEVLAIIREMK